MSLSNGMLPQLVRNVSNTQHIKPGLERIALLLKGVERPWRAIHIAGTNGKGSVCGYLAAMLGKAKIRTGRFTSPHMIDRWDCVQIDQQPVSATAFKEVEALVKKRNTDGNIDASSFELLTATAFELFTRENVAVGVVECGMGGRLDATNILEAPLATVISKIGLDHQAFLGDSYAKIALEKAGIMKRDSPCIIDSNSPVEALESIARAARDMAIDTVYTPLHRGKPWAASQKSLSKCGRDGDNYSDLFDIVGFQESSMPENQVQNMWCAYKTISLVLPALDLPQEHARDLAPVMLTASLPGRFQRVDISSIAPSRHRPILLDGAHNEDAFKDLVNQCSSFRTSVDPVIVWIMALSGGKEPGQILKHIDCKDKVIAVEFGPVDGMPWVKPVPAHEYEDAYSSVVIAMGRDLRGALEHAVKLAGDAGMIVVCGSLYLVGDVLRLLRDGA